MCLRSRTARRRIELTRMISRKGAYLKEQGSQEASLVVFSRSRHIGFLVLHDASCSTSRLTAVSIDAAGALRSFSGCL